MATQLSTNYAFTTPAAQAYVYESIFPTKEQQRILTYSHD